MKKQQKKTKEITVPVYMMNRELSWLKFNERVLNEAGNPRVPLAERLTFAAIYQSNLDEFYRVRVGTLMDQMEASEVIRKNKTNMTSEEQVTAIIQATRDLDQKKAAIYEQLMGELEPYGVRLINFNRLSAEEGKLLETYFDQEIAPYLSANIVSKQQPFPFLKNKNIYAVASLMSKGGKTKTAIIPCSNTVFRRLIDIPTRKGTFMLSEELILHFLPKMFKSYEIREKALLRITRNADIDADALYDEDLDYREFMVELIKARKKLAPIRLELSREMDGDVVETLCEYLEVDKNYALVISTSAGLWRYMIGDTVKFTQKDPYKFVITGRTKHFINAFGEELIVDNAEKGLARACEATGALISDYSAAPVFMDANAKCRHQWLIEFVQAPDSIENFAKILDDTLKEVNSDYEAKRQKNIALQPLEVIVARKDLFHDWLAQKGKLGGQHKVPRLSNTREYIEEMLELNN